MKRTTGLRRQRNAIMGDGQDFNPRHTGQIAHSGQQRLSEVTSLPVEVNTLDAIAATDHRVVAARFE